MTTIRPALISLRSTRLIEVLLLGVIVWCIVGNVSYLISSGFLPPPFIYDTSDDFMDWYNTAYYSNNPGAFDVWGAVYPPLSFIFIKIFSISACYVGDPVMGRECDWLGIVVLFIFFVTNGLIAFRCYRLNDRRTALIRASALTLGFPMLFALDRGNLIVPCFTCFALGHGRLLRSARLRWIAIALAVNFKPYLILSIFPLILRRRWRWFEGCILSCIFVYVASYALWGSGSPAQLIENEASYAQGNARGLFNAIYNPTSYTSIVDYLTYGFAIMRFVGSRPIEILTILFPILIRVGQVGVMLAFVAVGWRKTAVPLARLTAMSVAVTMTSTEVSGYAEVFLLFLVFYEPWRGPARIVALLAAYALSVPADYVLVNLAHEIKDSYLTNRTVGYDLSVNLGMLVRPGLLLIIQYALTAATLVDVFKPRNRGAPVSGAPLANIEFASA
jgi:hypothetical protein